MPRSSQRRAIGTIMADMRSTQRPARRLLAAAAFIPVGAACSLGSSDTGFSEAACRAALARCGYFFVVDFCRHSPSQCTMGGEPFVDPEGLFYIPPNQTVTINLSSVGLSERAVDLRFSPCAASGGAIEDFQIRLDGIDVDPDSGHTDDGEWFYRFPGHIGPPLELEVTWKGTTQGKLSANPPPKSCVSLWLQDRPCVAKAFTRECYDDTPRE